METPGGVIAVNSGSTVGLPGGIRKPRRARHPLISILHDMDPRSTCKPRRPALRPALGSSVWLAREDECCAGNNRGAGPDEGDINILDLARTGATGSLQGALNDVPQAVNAARAQAAAKRVQRQLAVKRDPAALNKVEGLALSAEAVGFKAVNHGG